MPLRGTSFEVPVQQSPKIFLRNWPNLTVNVKYSTHGAYIEYGMLNFTMRKY